MCFHGVFESVFMVFFEKHKAVWKTLNVFSHCRGRILRQEKGIPMGDPMSPAMTIGTCGWMEREWMNTLTIRDKISFRAKRYMDDILLFYTKHPSWNHEKFLADFLKSECYWKPLKLESAANNTFLETNFSANQWELSFRLKNPNEETRKVWRYHGYRSRIPYSIQRQILLCTLNPFPSSVSYMRRWARFAQGKTLASVSPGKS